MQTIEILCVGFINILAKMCHFMLENVNKKPFHIQPSFMLAS